MEATLLQCPIRGRLKTKQRAADNLTFTEEKQRIDAIKFLLQRKYPEDNFGVETTLFRLGRDGRNSFRTDFAIYDEPFKNLKGLPLEKRAEHIRLIAEIKRDNYTAEEAKNFQVRSALKLVNKKDTLGVYWDDVEQRFFYEQDGNNGRTIMDAPISKIPTWGCGVESVQLIYDDLIPARDLEKIFDDIEQALHPHIVDKVQRYSIIQQLLLAKIYDENTAGRNPNGLLQFQDFSIAAINDNEVVNRMNAALTNAANHYNIYLPPGKQIDMAFRAPPEALRNATRYLAPVNILKSKTQVIQAFYMKFAKSLYKWDLAQYFTPHEVIDFIVDVVNPRNGEHVHDPACGSGDFLISAFRKAGASDKSCVWGHDNSEQAVQISILNMVLNGDGKTSIKEKDSLQDYSARSQTYSVILCNPPFGTKIVERRLEVLRKFDMGHKFERSQSGQLVKTEEVRQTQQTGILFLELCSRLAKSGGRIAIIVPNGYLGNSGLEYLAARDWMLKHCRLVGIAAFPRFTFKKSGADVSASVLFLEKRPSPLRNLSDDGDYSFYSGNIESVGWRAGDKLAVPVYLRDPLNGDLILDRNNEPILDADFALIYDELLRSPVSAEYNWLLEGRDLPEGAQGWSKNISEVLSSPILNLDPKRHCQKFETIRVEIASRNHIALSEVLESVENPTIRIEKSTQYKYVEIERIECGAYDYSVLRGWELPSRARLGASPGDIFVPHIWSCVGKWFMAAGDCNNLIVTNGCSRFKVKADKQNLLPDLILGLSSELFKVQMRAFATGSDGLAEISDTDILSITVPIIADSGVRDEARRSLKALQTGQATFSNIMNMMLARLPDYPVPAPRKSHCSLI